MRGYVWQATERRLSPSHAAWLNDGVSIETTGVVWVDMEGGRLPLGGTGNVGTMVAPYLSKNKCPAR
jgi:hypothetical protein